MAYALTYPDRPIYMYLLFPIQVKYFVPLRRHRLPLVDLRAAAGSPRGASGRPGDRLPALQSRHGAAGSGGTPGQMADEPRAPQVWRISGGHKNDWERRIH
jgi:hypothetical protein